MVCTEVPNSGVSIDKCTGKLMRHNRYHVDFQVTLNHTIKSFFIHYAMYYKFSNNEYRPFMINVWEDFCGYMNGDKKNLVIGIIYPNIREYTNMNHTCPYKPGLNFVTMYNLSIHDFVLDFIIPSGRYYLEINGHSGFEGPMIGQIKVYGSVSDHRVDKF